MLWDVMYDHHAQNSKEMDLRVGDLIGIYTVYKNGYTKGINVKTRKVGLFPSYILKHHVDIGQFPIYGEVIPEARLINKGYH